MKTLSEWTNDMSESRLTVHAVALMQRHMDITHARSGPDLAQAIHQYRDALNMATACLYAVEEHGPGDALWPLFD